MHRRRTLHPRDEQDSLAARRAHQDGQLMYRSITRGIEVKVRPQFVADRSSPKEAYFFWAYTIEIANNGPDAVQLKTRHWRITDAQGRVQEVKGAGVVGEEPVLA